MQTTGMLTSAHISDIFVPFFYVKAQILSHSRNSQNNQQCCKSCRSANMNKFDSNLVNAYSQVSSVSSRPSYNN